MLQDYLDLICWLLLSNLANSYMFKDLLEGRMPALPSDFDDSAVQTLSTFVTWVAAGSLWQSEMVAQGRITKTSKSGI